VPVTGPEIAKIFRDRRRAERESACQLNTINSVTAADSLMELNAEMRSADTDMDVDEPRGPVGVQLMAAEVRPPTHELLQETRTASNTWVVFLTNDSGHECSVCDRLWVMRDRTKVINKYVDAHRQDLKDETIAYFRVCTACKQSLNRDTLISLCRTKCFAYPPNPEEFPPLDLASKPLLSSRLPFKHIRHLRHECRYGTACQFMCPCIFLRW
jgi:hypothetical protein